MMYDHRKPTLTISRLSLSSSRLHASARDSLDTPSKANSIPLPDGHTIRTLQVTPTAVQGRIAVTM